jgi:predicted Zn finger-like uncharacterized protein
MIITCPACQTQYTVNAASFGAAGRSVKCKRCGNVWRQAPETPAAADVAPPVAAPEPVSPAPASSKPVSPPPPEPVPAQAPEPEAAIAAATAEAAPERVEEPSGLEPAERPSLTAEEQPSFFQSTRFAGIALAASFVLFLTALVVFRDGVQTALPFTGSLYRIVGLRAVPLAYALEIHGVTTTKSEADGKPALVVAGDLDNDSKTRQTVPKLRILLRSADDKLLASQDFPADKPNLLPGESAHFQATMLDPPSDAASATVTFAQ